MATCKNTHIAFYTDIADRYTRLDPTLLTARLRFHNIGNMEMNQAVEALGALAQGTRLAIFRLLVEAGPKGLAAGRIGGKLDLPPATLSFHLSQLAHTGLVKGRQEGRFVIYTADFEAMTELVGYLTENCCGGAYCGPVTSIPVAMKRPARKRASRAHPR